MVSVEKKIKILKFVQIIQRSAFLAGEKNKLKNRYEKKIGVIPYLNVVNPILNASGLY